MAILTPEQFNQRYGNVTNTTNVNSGILTQQQFQQRYGGNNLVNKLNTGSYSGNQSLIDKISSGINTGLNTYKNLPVIKQLSQGVGEVVKDVVAKPIGTFVGGVMETGNQLSNLFSGKGFNAKQIYNTANQSGQNTGEFGYTLGKETAPMAPLGGGGKILQGTLALQQGYEGYKGISSAIKTGDWEQGVNAALNLATSIWMAKGLKDTNGLLVNKDVVNQVKTNVNNIFRGGNENVINNIKTRAAEVYREVLKPSKTEIKNIEIYKGGDINNAYKTMIDNGVIIESTPDGKLNTRQGLNKINQALNIQENKIQSELATNNTKQFNLNFLRNKAIDVIKERASKNNEATVKTNDRIADVDYLLDAEGKRLFGQKFNIKKPSNRNQYLTGVEYNIVKRKMGNLGWNQERPTMNSTARVISNEALSDLQSKYGEIKGINSEYSNLIAAQRLLQNAHGRVVNNGKIGTYAAGIVGSIVGHSTNIPVIGPVLGHAIGKETVRYLNSPERITSRQLNKIKSIKNLPKPININLQERPGFARIPQKFYPDDMAILEDFVDSTRLKNYMSVQTEIDARRIAESYGINPDVSNAQLANKLTKILDEYYAKNKKEIKVNGVSTSKTALGEVDDVLLKEARKYKTVGEFMEAQWTPVYHGTDVAKIVEKEGFKKMPIKTGVSAFGEGSYFTNKIGNARGYGDIVRAFLKKDIKLKKVLDSDAYKVDSQKLIKEGYDGTIMETGNGNNIVIFDNANIKTKSQLTDIWNKANKKDIRIKKIK